MTSVGYGDLFPKTSFGRLVGIMICFCGVFIVSFFVVTVTNILEFSGLEDKAYELLLRLSYKS
jgi:potassium voltage-gated channel Shab-related subfamily B protein 2